jgi:hypothetical protein
MYCLKCGVTDVEIKLRNASLKKEGSSRIEKLNWRTVWRGGKKRRLSFCSNCLRKYHCRMDFDDSFWSHRKPSSPAPYLQLMQFSSGRHHGMIWRRICFWRDVIDLNDPEIWANIYAIIRKRVRLDSDHENRFMIQALAKGSGRARLVNITGEFRLPIVHRRQP